jgi:hypothetical protein
MSKLEKMNLLLKELLTARWDDYGEDEMWVEYRPFNGYYICWEWVRYIGDEGEYIGSNYKEAREYLIYLYKD